MGWLEEDDVGLLLMVFVGCNDEMDIIEMIEILLVLIIIFIK